MEKLLSKKEVAELLGLSIHTIDKWVSERRKIPFIKLGGRVLFRIEDIETFISSNTIEPFQRRGE